MHNVSKEDVWLTSCTKDVFHGIGCQVLWLIEALWRTIHYSTLYISFFHPIYQTNTQSHVLCIWCIWEWLKLFLYDLAICYPLGERLQSKLLQVDNTVLRMETARVIAVIFVGARKCAVSRNAVPVKEYLPFSHILSKQDNRGIDMTDWRRTIVCTSCRCVETGKSWES